MDNKFFIFGRSSCPFCTMSADFLEAKNLNYTFLDFVDNPKILEDYKSFYKQNTVPIILSNNKETGKVHKIGGYTDLLAFMEK